MSTPHDSPQTRPRLPLILLGIVAVGLLGVASRAVYTLYIVESGRHSDRQSIPRHLQTLLQQTQNTTRKNTSHTPHPNTPHTSTNAHTKVQGAWERAHASPLAASKTLFALAPLLTDTNATPLSTPQKVPPHCHDFWLPAQSTDPAIAALDNTTCLHALTLLSPLNSLQDAGATSLQGPVTLVDPWARFTRQDSWPTQPLKALTLLTIVRARNFALQRQTEESVKHFAHLLNVLQSLSDRSSGAYVLTHVSLEDLVLDSIIALVHSAPVLDLSAPHRETWLQALSTRLAALPKPTSYIPHMIRVLLLEEIYSALPNQTRDPDLFPKGLLPRASTRPEPGFFEARRNESAVYDYLRSWGDTPVWLEMNDISFGARQMHYISKHRALYPSVDIPENQRPPYTIAELDTLLTYIEARRALVYWVLRDALHTLKSPLQPAKTFQDLGAERSATLDPFSGQPMDITEDRFCINPPPKARKDLNRRLRPQFCVPRIRGVK